MTIDLTSIAASIKSEMTTLATHQKGMAEAACRVGRYLTDAKKELVTEEGFEAWVKANCEFSYQTACRYVRLAAHWGTFTEHQRAKSSVSNLLDLVKGKGRKGKGKAKKGGRRVKAERVRALATQFGITGKVDEFLSALGVRVVVEKKAKKLKLAA